jgi:hypothetical protein
LWIFCSVCPLAHLYAKNPTNGSLRLPLGSLQGKKSPDRRFFGILRAKHNKLLETVQSGKRFIYTSNSLF